METSVAGIGWKIPLPLISRYPGSKITHYKISDFDELQIPLGKAIDDPHGALGESQQVEGKITMIWYGPPENRSTLEVFRNYEQALSKAGFVTLFSCKGFEECGPLTKGRSRPPSSALIPLWNAAARDARKMKNRRFYCRL